MASGLETLARGLRWPLVAIIAGPYLYYGSAYLPEFVPTPIKSFGSKFAVRADTSVGDAANVLVALVALGALLVAWYQLHGLALQTRANVLMALDQRWEGPEIQGVRQGIDAFIAEVRRKLAGAMTEVELFPVELARMRNTDPDRYALLFRICSFYETLGYSVRANYIKLDDVYGLFEGSILETGTVFRQHIKNRQLELQTEGFSPESANGFYQHYVWLVDECVRLREETFY